MQDDPIVAEVRAVRERLAAQFDFDVHAIFADLRSRQAKLGARLVRRVSAASAPAGPNRSSGACPPAR